ncbi:MAG: hypothetical protein IMZ50_10995, partial [Candidatus Atribacteria bacterium]|nr:hypothetical protein [Candidatus Atribacteria bacterium]
MNGMTIKQIAELCNVAESTVRSWVRKTADSAVVSAKIADCRGREPAQLSVDETLSIIRAGGNDTLADLLAQNAGQAPAAAASPTLILHDVDMVLMGYRRGLQDAGVAPASPVHPSRKALPAPRVQRVPIS